MGISPKSPEFRFRNLNVYLILPRIIASVFFQKGSVKCDEVVDVFFCLMVLLFFTTF